MTAAWPLCLERSVRTVRVRSFNGPARTQAQRLGCDSNRFSHCASSFTICPRQALRRARARQASCHGFARVGVGDPKRFVELALLLANPVPRGSYRPLDRRFSAREGSHARAEDCMREVEWMLHRLGTVRVAGHCPCLLCVWEMNLETQ